MATNDKSIFREMCLLYRIHLLNFIERNEVMAVIIMDTDSLCSISETRIMAEIVKEPVTVSYKNRVPTFTVKIKDFNNKMKTWPSGKCIMTESFTVDSLNDVTMNLQIYPNGDDAENEGNVSVNESNGDIQIDCTVKMKKGDEADEVFPR